MTLFGVHEMSCIKSNKERLGTVVIKAEVGGLDGSVSPAKHFRTSPKIR